MPRLRSHHQRLHCAERRMAMGILGRSDHRGRVLDPLSFGAGVIRAHDPQAPRGAHAEGDGQSEHQSPDRARAEGHPAYHHDRVDEADTDDLHRRYVRLQSCVLLAMGPAGSPVGIMSETYKLTRSWVPSNRLLLVPISVAHLWHLLSFLPGIPNHLRG